MSKADVEGRKTTKPGTKVSIVLKIVMGWILFIILILLIFLPMILFSSLNPTTSINNVISGNFEMGFNITDLDNE
jgi:hypothetical protein